MSQPLTPHQRTRVVSLLNPEQFGEEREQLRKERLRADREARACIVFGESRWVSLIREQPRG